MRIYVDTSVFGGYFEPGFDVPTRQLFQMFIRGEARLVLSELTARELGRAPEHVQAVLLQVPPQHREEIGTMAGAEALAELYIREGIMRPSMHVDALHIATAVLAGVDMLVSWNFRDIVNDVKVRGYNAINTRLGYPVLKISTPREVIRWK